MWTLNSEVHVFEPNVPDGKIHWSEVDQTPHQMFPDDKSLFSKEPQTLCSIFRNSLYKICEFNNNKGFILFSFWLNLDLKNLFDLKRLSMAWMFFSIYWKLFQECRQTKWLIVIGNNFLLLCSFKNKAIFILGCTTNI